MRSSKRRKYLHRTRHTVRKVVTLHEGPWRWSIGIQAGIAIGLPVAVFTLAGHQSLGLVASLGGFTALYCAAWRRSDKLRILPLVAVGLIIASLIGVLCAPAQWLTISGLVLVAALSCTFTLGTGLGPPGPLMFVLVTGVSGHLAAPVSRGGAAFPGHLIPVLVALGAFIACLVVIGPLALPAVRKQDRSRPRHPLLLQRIRIRFNREKALIAARVIAGVAIASLVSRPLGAHRAYWVMLAAVAVLQAGHSRQITVVRAIQRVVGTLLGVIVFELISFTAPSGMWLVMIIMLLQFATEVVVTRNYVLALIFITPLALSITTASHTGNILVSVEGRVLDTLLGAAIAMLVLWISEKINRDVSRPVA